MTASPWHGLSPVEKRALQLALISAVVALLKQTSAEVADEKRKRRAA